MTQSEFDPNAVGQLSNGIFGLPFTPETAQLVIVPVEWEVTTSYGGGTADGPTAIFEASAQVDLYHPDFPDMWKSGIAMTDAVGRQDNDHLRPVAEQLIVAQVNGENPDDRAFQASFEQIHQAGDRLRKDVKKQTLFWLDQGKQVGLLGGDHSTPLGFYEALATKYPEFGILQFDAHMDLRDAYEGFGYSHASIMFNALKIPELKRLVQVGIRDYCEAEHDLVKASNGRVHVVSDMALKEAVFQGKNWAELCNDIIETLPQYVHISFDIDGLNPALCPHTGTPVPGGLQLEEAAFLLKKLAQSGRKIIGFDLVEVSPGSDEWDANVGARLLYLLAGYMSMSCRTV